MATANALKSSQLAAKLDVSGEESTMPRETIVLIAGLIVGFALFAVAILNYTGAETIELRAGEGAGINPALDFMVLGIAAMCGPYGFVATAKFHRIQKIEDRLPDFLRDVAEAGRFGMTLPDAIIVASRGRYGLLT
jgi:pilus assembly protein TadC